MLSTRRITSLALPWRNRIRPVTVASGVLCKYAVASAVLCVRGVVSGHMQFSGFIYLLFYCVARFHVGASAGTSDSCAGGSARVLKGRAGLERCPAALVAAWLFCPLVFARRALGRTFCCSLIEKLYTYTTWAWPQINIK